jgi:hypothetical protein
VAASASVLPALFWGLKVRVRSDMCHSAAYRPREQFREIFKAMFRGNYSNVKDGLSVDLAHDGACMVLEQQMCSVVSGTLLSQLRSSQPVQTCAGSTICNRSSAELPGAVGHAGGRRCMASDRRWRNLCCQPALPEGCSVVVTLPSRCEEHMRNTMLS